MHGRSVRLSCPLVCCAFVRLRNRLLLHASNFYSARSRESCAAETASKIKFEQRLEFLVSCSRLKWCLSKQQVGTVVAPSSGYIAAVVES